MKNIALKRVLLNYGPLIAALLLEIIVFESIGRAQYKPGFASVSGFIMILNQASYFGVMAIGMTFIIITAGIDLSVGSLAALSGVLCALVAQKGGDPVWAYLFLGMTVSILVGMSCGLFSGLLITWLDIPPFIATLALMSSLRGLANLITNGKPVSPLPEAYNFLGRYRIADTIPVSVIVFLVALGVGMVLLKHTAFGRHVRAIGGNEESARLSGINVRKTKCLVYILGGVLTAIGGLILSSRLGAGSPKIGLGDELTVIAAVVVGGTSLSGGVGSITGTFVGLLVVSVLNSGLNWIGVETFGQQVILGLVILAAVLLDRVKAWAKVV